MCSAECTLCPNTADRKNSKYYALADITSLRFDVRAFAYVYMLRALRVPRRSKVNATAIAMSSYPVVRLRALRVPRRSKVNATAIAMSSYPVVRHVYHGASSRRYRELKYSSQPIAKNQATMTPKVWISTCDSSLRGHLRRSSL